MRITERITENTQNFGQRRPVVIGFLEDSVTQGCFELYRKDADNLETES